MKNNEENLPELLEDLERLHAFMNNSPVVAFMKDANGRYVYANKKLEDMFRISFAELQGKTDFEWLPAEIAQNARENDQNVLENGQIIELFETVPTPDGATKYWMVLKFPFTNAAGQKFVGGAAIDITERQEIEEKLRQSEQEIRSLIENSSDVIVRYDTNLRYLYVNPHLIKITGISKEQFIGKTMLEVGLPEAVWLNSKENLEKVIETKEESVFEFEYPTPFGNKFAHSRMTPEFAADGTVKSVLVISRDITALKENEKNLRRSESHFRHLIEDSQGFICTHDRNGNILSINPAAANSLGYKVSETVGRNLRDFMDAKHHAKLNAQLELVWQNKTDNGFLIMRTKQGREQIWKYHNIKLTETVEAPFILCYSQDVTEMHEIQKNLASLSLTDDLTSLYNRRGFLMLAKRHLNIIRARPTGKGVYLIFADIDGLKQINDQFGHDQGSLAISKISEILAGNFRASDVISRLGGDEFVVLVTDADEESQEIVLKRLQTKIENYNAERNHPFDLSISIGVTTISIDNSISIEELIVEADKAMYENKRSKKRTICDE